MSVIKYKTDEKRTVIQYLKNCIEIKSPEQALWFAVLERAILDIGIKVEPTPDEIRHGISAYVRHIQCSRLDFTGKDESQYFINAGTSRGFVVKTLERVGVLPLPKDHHQPVSS